MMRVLAVGKWSKEQKRWLKVVALTRKPAIAAGRKSPQATKRPKLSS